MKKLEAQFQRGTEYVKLEESDKARMRESIVSYMEYKPIRSSVDTQVSKPSFLPFFRMHHVSGALVIATVLTTSTFGVSFAAGDALPGDLLYGVKVNINEEVKTAFLNEADRMAWEQERAKRRLVEASQLAAEGKLDDDAREQVSKLFAEHTEAVVEQVLAYEATDPVLAAEASSEFEESLDAHEAVLARLIVESEDEPQESSIELVEQVRTAAMEVGKIREDAEEKIGTTEKEGVEGTEGTDDVTAPVDEDGINSANMRVRATYRAQARVFELLENAENLYGELDPSSETGMQVSAQIEHGKVLLAEGNTALGEYNYSDAYSVYREAVALLQKVVQLLEVAKLFSVQIYPSEDTTVRMEDESIEEVQVVEEGVQEDETVTTGEGEEDTEFVDEHVAELTQLRAEVEADIQHARTLLLTKNGFEVSTVEQVNAHIKDAVAYQLRGDIAFVLEDYDDAEELFTKALKLIQRTIETLEGEIEEKGEQITDTPQEETTDVQADETTEEQRYVLTHTYTEGVHTYTGSLELETPCHVVGTVASEEDGVVSLAITIDSNEDEVGCLQVQTEKSYSASIEAPEDVQLGHVYLNGVEIPWDLVQTEVLGDAVSKEEEGEPATGDDVGENE